MAALFFQDPVTSYWRHQDCNSGRSDPRPDALTSSHASVPSQPHPPRVQRGRPCLPSTFLPVVAIMPELLPHCKLLWTGVLLCGLSDRREQNTSSLNAPCRCRGLVSACVRAARPRPGEREKPRHREGGVLPVSLCLSASFPSPPPSGPRCTAAQPPRGGWWSRCPWWSFNTHVSHGP